jgi:hypothetical protein
MKEEESKEEKIRKMLRKDSYQRILDEIARFSLYENAKLLKFKIINEVARDVFPGGRDGVRKTMSAIDLFSSPEYGIVGVNENYILTNEKTFKYASRK